MRLELVLRSSGEFSKVHVKDITKRGIGGTYKKKKCCWKVSSGTKGFQFTCYDASSILTFALELITGDTRKGATNLNSQKKSPTKTPKRRKRDLTVNMCGGGLRVFFGGVWPVGEYNEA